MARTWTSAFGAACGWLLDRIVHGLALTKISPNALTFIGLVINIVAAFFFGHANATNADWMFFYAGMVIFGAGLFDMVDGRVARRTHQVTVFGSFFDSVIDRYSDVVLFFGLLVYYGRINRFRYVVLVAFVMVTSLMVSYTNRAGDYRRSVQPLGRNGSSAVGSGRTLDHHRRPSHYLYLPKHQASGSAELRADGDGVVPWNPAPDALDCS
jgi:phosphatidylglycerophosphate synthase